MTESIQRYDVDIHHHHYVIKCRETIETVNKVVKCLNQQFNQAQQNQGILNYQDTAVMIAFNLMAEKIALQEQLAQQKQVTQNREQKFEQQIQTLVEECQQLKNSLPSRRHHH